MIIKEMFYIPIKLKPKLARATISVAFGEDIAIFPSFQFLIRLVTFGNFYFV